MRKRSRSVSDEPPPPPPQPVHHWWHRADNVAPLPLVGTRDLSAEMRHPNKAPAHWAAQWDAIFAARAQGPPAPVDLYGCERLFEHDADPATQRYQKLCSLILSAQSKDEKTHESMCNLFALPGGLRPSVVVALEPAHLEQLIRPSGLYRAKAKALLATSCTLLERYGGDVPPSLPLMLELAGVGPKIGALAMSVCWGVDVSIGVDTHVARITQRLGWAPKQVKPDAEKTRAALEDWLPASLWRPINYGLVGFGQTVCAAKPNCAECPVALLCPSVQKNTANKAK